MQNNLHRRHEDISKLKRVYNLPLCTIFESKELIANTAQNPLSPTCIVKSREKSLNFFCKPLQVPLEKLSPTSASILRTSSLSPGRKDVEMSNLKKKFHFPMPGTQAKLLYLESLSSIEIKEIGKYQEIYFLGEKAAKIEKYTDSEGRYKGEIGDQLGFRYEILEKIGKGAFSNVYKCFDHKRDLLVAVKVIRNIQAIRQQADIEIENLEKIGESDPDDSKSIVKMRQVFDFRGHICISFELLSQSLYQFLLFKSFNGLSKNLIKRIAVQVLIGLRHIHKLGFIHCDLKPENILLKNPNKSSIKIIDFGSASYKCISPCAYIQSRYYRAPEVILGGIYNEKIDIWSFACILYELYSGRPLFAGESEKDQIWRIVQVLGKPPDEVLCMWKRKNEFFFEEEWKDSRGNVVRPGEIKLSCLVDDLEFCDFLKKCLEYDIEARVSADEALKHPWITVNTQRTDRSRNWYKAFNS